MTSTENPPEIQITVDEPQVPIRKDHVEIAVKFLNNANVAKTSSTQKRQFLKTKGLSELEIEEAFKLSLPPTQQYATQMGPGPMLPPPPPHYLCTEPTIFMKIRDGLQSMAIFSGLLYSIYLFYKRFISPYLFGASKKVTFEDRLENVNSEMKLAISEIQETITKIHEDVSTISLNQKDSKMSERHLDELKTEIATVKGLLLNRKQFPPVANSPVVPPSIPAWQLSSVDAAVEDETTEPDKCEELIEIGSGSGSSETEVVTKNSDSSIEIM